MQCCWDVPQRTACCLQGGEFAGQQDDGAAVAEEVSQAKSGKGSGSGPTLGDIIAAGILMPGHDSLSVTYKGVKYFASLMDDGAITFQGASIAA